MPSESLPRDRKEFFRERGGDRFETLGGGGGGPSAGGGGGGRWRDLRRPPGYGKQGGWHMYPGESFHGYGPTRPNGNLLDHDSYRPYGRYGRNGGRENRERSFSQRDWKGHGWDDAANEPQSGPARMQVDVGEKRSVDDILTYNSLTHSDFGTNYNQFHFKGQHDKNGGISDSCTAQRYEREKSLGSTDWKSLKWTRSGSLSSSGPGFSLSSSSKSVGVDSRDTNKDEDVHKILSPVQCPLGETAACVTSATPTEETGSRKKPRLGWGEGLAKYEKKKVDVPDETSGKNETIVCESNTEAGECKISNVADGSPGTAGVSDDASLATPSSVACSSSPGARDKSFTKSMNAETVNLCASPHQEYKNQAEGLAFNLENLGSKPIANISSLLDELLQSDSQSSMDSGYVRSIAMSKVLKLKDDISKKLEVTESEIDLLENELKLLISDIGRTCQYPVSSSSLPVLCIHKPSEEPCSTSTLIPRPSSLNLNLCDVMNTITPCEVEGKFTESKTEDIDSPGTATSLLTESPLVGKVTAQDDKLEPGKCFGGCKEIGVDFLVKCSVHASKEESPGATPIKHTTSSSHILLTDASLHRDKLLCDSIMASNKDSAHRASEVLNKLLPVNLSCVDISQVVSTPCKKSDEFAKEKFAMRKRFLRFKVRVVTLKFRAFQHLWKEDLRLLSIRRCRAKSQKKFEPSSRLVRNGAQKLRSSVCSRFSALAGNLSLVPTTEVINFTSKLLADSHFKIYRSALKMPALVLDKNEKTSLCFISSNGLVEDPCADEKERCMINAWTSQEKKIFLDKFASFGKDFRKIALFLDHKTTADCVEFYYKNHKSDCFQKTKKPEFSKKENSYPSNTYLVTSGKRWNHDKNAASLDMLGEASEIAAAKVDYIMKNQKCAARLSFGTSCDSKTARSDDGTLERSSGLEILPTERETVAADVLAGISGSLLSEAMSSCITSSVDFGEGYQERRGQTVGSSVRRPMTPEVSQNVDYETCSDESCMELYSAAWTDVEKSIFIRAVGFYGKDFAMISQCVGTRSLDECKVFFSKARQCLGLDMICPGALNGGTPSCDNINRGAESDTEDACVVETGSVTCCGRLVSEMDDGRLISCSNVNQYETYPSGTFIIPSDLDQLAENNKIREVEVKNIDLMSENIVSGDYAKTNVPSVFDNEGKIKNCGGSESVVVQVLENGFMMSDTGIGRGEVLNGGTLEVLPIVQGTIDNGKPSTADANSEGFAVESRGEKGAAILLAGNGLVDKQVYSEDVNLSATICLRQGMSIAQPSVGNAFLSAGMESLAIGVLPGNEKIAAQSIGNVSMSAGVDSMAVGAYTRNEHKIAVKLGVENPCADSSSQYNCSETLNSNSFLTYPAAVQKEKGANHNVASDSDPVKTIDEHFPNFTGAELKHQHGLSLLDGVDDSQILRGFPVLVSATKGMNEHISCNTPVLCQSIPKTDKIFSLHHSTWLRRCNNISNQHAGDEPHVMSTDQSQDNPGELKPQYSLESDKLKHNGDVKLFGKILSNPSSEQKLNSRVQEKEDRVAQHSKSSDNSLNLRFTGNKSVGVLASAKFDPNRYLRFENLPVRRSFGFWDGTRIQTGFPSMPDSAVLLAKYPAAFGNFLTPSQKLDQHQLHPIVGITNCTLNGVSVFPTQEISGNKEVDDYRAYRSRDAITLQPNGMFSEIQKRGNEFDAMSSMQHQARGLMGINVMGRGGMLLGGAGGSVSEPVAAIRMHYAKNDQYGTQMGNIISREDESWRGKVEIGR